MSLSPPRLKNDCFALPPGVDWTPVDDALARLRERLQCVVPSDERPVIAAGGMILAQDVVAERANPPAANSAVDGYGFYEIYKMLVDPEAPIVALDPSRDFETRTLEQQTVGERQDIFHNGGFRLIKHLWHFALYRVS